MYKKFKTISHNELFLLSFTKTNQFSQNSSHMLLGWNATCWHCCLREA